MLFCWAYSTSEENDTDNCIALIRNVVRFMCNSKRIIKMNPRDNSKASSRNDQRIFVKVDVEMEVAKILILIQHYEASSW